MAVPEERHSLATRGSPLMAAEMRSLVSSLEQQDRFKKMDKVKQDALRQALTEASVRLMGSTRLASTFIQRRNVAGYSTDLTRATADYTRDQARYLARLRYQPRIDAAVDAMDEYIAGHRYDKQNTRRSELRNALVGFLHEPVPERPGAFGTASRKLLQLSRLDKLGGVSFHVINSQEPWTTAMPVIAGRHSYGRTIRTLGEMYNVIGARSGLVAGLKDTVKAFHNDSGFADYLGMFKNEIANSKVVGGEKAKRLSAIIDYLDRRGLYNQEAIFEMARQANPQGNVISRAIDRADLMANQVGDAIEKINRTVTALTAGELEFQRTGNMERALEYAYETTHDTMGDYSSWNAPQVFNHPLGRLALQFKKYAHKTYYLLGKTVGGALRGDVEAARQFAGLMATHAVVAGALGLPLEPFKVALMAANLAGLTGYNYQDFEKMVRLTAGRMLGSKGGEVFAHGLTRLANIDTSSRQGLDTLLTFGQPRSEKTDDVKAWLFTTIAGAPAAWLLDQYNALQAVKKGQYAKALELGVPLKAASDITKAAV
ncbi:MAG: PLxRFG domain-containing protein, partial [Ktedonobacterales bacterium]